MLKMLTTQLTGLFKKIADQEEFALEDGARLLAQAPAGDGTIYLFATGEMKAVVAEATEGAETLVAVHVLTDSLVDSLTSADRVLLFTRYNVDREALELAKRLKVKNIPFVSVSAISEHSLDVDLLDLSPVHIQLQLKAGLLPDEQGERHLLPFSMAALFVYHILALTVDEILKEFQQ